MPSFNQFYQALVTAGINLVSDTIKIALLTNSWTPDRTLNYYNQLTGELTADNGYTAGGITLANKTANVSNDVLFFDADNPAWNFEAAKSFRYAVIYKDSGTGSTSTLLWYIDLNNTGDLIVTGLYILNLNENGLISLSDAA